MKLRMGFSLREDISLTLSLVSLIHGLLPLDKVNNWCIFIVSLTLFLHVFSKKKKKNFIFACTREKNLIIGYRINSIKMNSQLQYIFS